MKRETMTKQKETIRTNFFKKIEFYDGETIDDNYVLLGNSEKYIFNVGGLSLIESLDFLFNDNKENEIGFFFRIDYDLNMIFANSDFEKDEKLICDFFDGEQIKIGGYNLTYYRHKILIMRKGKKRKNFYDVSNFLQTSFLKTLDKFEIEISKKDLEFIEKFKDKRSGFTYDEIQQIIEYNKKECKYGIDLVKRIYDLLPNDLKTTKLYGSSSIAHKFLKNYEMEKVNFFFLDILNSKPFENAYFGGRMEALKIGKFDKCYKYDINSAYPTTINELREVRSVEINNKFDIKKDKIVSTNLYFIEFEINDYNSIGLLPFRLKSGYLIFPKKVKNYFYGVEIIEALKFPNTTIKIKQEIKIGLGLELFNNQIKELYDLRLKLKKKNDLRQYIYKILINSIYGKFAQQTGRKTFLNFYYAGLITASTRAKLLNAVRGYENEIIFFATDGILSKKKLPNVLINQKLGGWDFERYISAYVVQSGVYQLIDHDGVKHYAERGFRADFPKLLRDVKNTGKHVLKSSVFIGNKWFSKNKNAFAGSRCKFKTVEREINIHNQFKRNFPKINLRAENSSLILDNKNIKELNELLPIENFEFEDFEILNKLD
jgi:hypothetical protein